MLDMSDIAQMLSDSKGISLATVMAVYRYTFTMIRDLMNEGKEIDIPQFGRFGFRKRKAVIRPSIAGGKSYTPASRTIKFYPAASWASWIKRNTSDLPDELPEGCKLSERYSKYSEIRKKYGDERTSLEMQSNDNSRMFFEKVIIPRSQRKHNK